MKINIFFTLYLCKFTFLSAIAFGQQPFKTNEFVIGICYPNYFMYTDASQQYRNYCWGYKVLIDTCPYISYNNNVYPTSVLNQFSQDGFNTYFTFQPSDYSASWKMSVTLIQLIKNNNLKLVTANNSWFVPISPLHDDNGVNVYDNNMLPHGFPNDPNYNDSLYNLKARPDYTNFFTAKCYLRQDLKNHIFAHGIGGEFNFLHKHNFSGQITLWNDSIYYSREIPPENVSDALCTFKNLADPNQKIGISIVNHNCSINEESDDCEWNNMIGSWELTPIDHDPQEYVDFPCKPDVIFEESYTRFPLSDWYMYPYNNIFNKGYSCYNYNNDTCAKHYLSKFKNIDFLKTKCKEVHATSSAEIHVLNDSTIEHYNSTSIFNANWLWFQAYTSIIHGVRGFWLYGYGLYGNNPEDLASQNIIASLDYDRFEYKYFPKLYKEYVRHLARELAYLKLNEFITSDENSIVMTKTDHEDVNCIVQINSIYPPSTFPSGYGPLGDLPDDLTEPTYSLRYSMRTNSLGEVIFIVTNPLNIPVTVTLDFNNIANPTVRNSTGLRILFEKNFPDYTTVTSCSYKVIRESGIDFNSINNTEANYCSFKFNQLNDKSITLSFGPMDVHVLKFISNPIPSYHNGWNNIWSNFGSGNISGWNILSTDKFYPGDFNGDGRDELLCIQGYSSNAWATFFNYNNDNWEWYWSNYGNGFLNNSSQLWQIRAGDIFYVGDYNGDGIDDLFCIQSASDGNLMKIIYFNGDNWQQLWTNHGNPNNGNGIYACRFNLTVGDYDGDNIEEVIGVNGDYIRMFSFANDNWFECWSSNGDINHMMYPYRNRLYAGDYDGDGQSDLLGIDTWATVFHFDDNNNPFHWNWGACASDPNGFMGGWQFYPPVSSDVIITGNLDDYDTKDEIFWIQTGTNAAWATSMEDNGIDFTANWTTNGLNGIPFIDDWPLYDDIGTDERYFLIKPSSSTKKYLIAMRKYGCNNRYLLNMYNTNANNNYFRTTDSEISVNLSPNPSNGLLSIKYFIDKYSQIKVIVTNSIGQVIKVTSFLTSLGLNENILDLHSIDNGMYYITISFENKKITRKLVLIR